MTLTRISEPSVCLLVVAAVLIVAMLAKAIWLEEKVGVNAWFLLVWIIIAAGVWK